MANNFLGTSEILPPKMDKLNGKAITEKRKKRINIDQGLTTTGLLMTLIDDKMKRTNDENSRKVVMLHSDCDSDSAKAVVAQLNKNSKFRAIADCELYVFKMMSFISYISAAIEWADVVVPLLTDSYLNDVKSVDSSIWRPSGSLHARHGFKMLQHKFYNDNNFPIVAAVKEGTNHDCHEFIEFRKCIHLSKDFSELEETILQISNTTSETRTE